MMHAPWSLREMIGATTYAEALTRSRTRIAETEPELRAWVVPTDVPDTATGPLGGVPLGVKDIIDVAGVPTRCGTPLRADAAPAEADAPIVAAWRRAGAVPVGKTVTTEFAYYFPGPTRNPAAPGRTPGGSSSGSAAAVAAGHVPLALGTQTAGSVTRPASFCGIASLVLTHDRIPMTGVSGLAPSLDSHGVYAAGVTDLALAWSAFTGDAEQVADGPPRLLVWSAASLVGPEMAAVFAAARDQLGAAGAVVDDFPDALAAQAIGAHPVVMAYEAAREHATVVSQVSPQLAELVRTGAAIPGQAYENARQAITVAHGRVAELLASYDAVLAPATIGPAPEGLASTGDPVLSRAWQALGLPAVAVPGQRTRAGLPLGLQLVGRQHEEAALLAAGCWVETALLDRHG